MRNKSMQIALAMLLLLSAFAMTGNADDMQRKELKVNFSIPEIIRDDNYIRLEVNGATTTTHEDTAPMLPVKKVVIEFPMGTVIKEVRFFHDVPKAMSLDAKVKPNPTPIPLNGIKAFPVKEKDEKIYGSASYYPEDWLTYEIKVGLNGNNERTAFLIVDIYPVRYSPANDEIRYITKGTLEVLYKEPSKKPTQSKYDLLIISAPAYVKELKRLVAHKEKYGIKTKLVSVDEIENEGRDLQEKIKYYIKRAVEAWDVKYVLLVGGYRSFFGLDKHNLQLPVRYVYLNDGGEDGFVSDLYYADIYRYDPKHGYAFDSWDSNCNGRYGEWDWYGYDEIDHIPDVHLGRLACRAVWEVKIMVDKIINYESRYSVKEDWFKRMLVVTGDDFQDQNKLDIEWNASAVPNGDYYIHAQAFANDGEKGEVHTVHVIVNHQSPSYITFSEEDHLITGLHYPSKPVACITVPSDGNILGNTDVEVDSPPGAYGGYRWTPIIYKDGILHIMGKGYDPRPQADGHAERTSVTVKVWITNGAGQVIFGPVEKESEVWFEGEWETEKALNYMPKSFDRKRLWTSNGLFHGTEEDPVDGINVVLEELNKGYGFVYFAGHANPMTWADHYPGIPGGRRNSDVAGLYQINFHLKKPLFPLDTLTNGYRLPVVVLSGCHPSAIDCSFMKLLVDPYKSMYTAKSGIWAPECLSWWLTRVKEGGAIATLGPSGLGYGMLGRYCTEGVGGWLWPEFFRQYGEEGKDILGEMFTQALTNYIIHFGPDLDLIDTKTVEEMILLGDPTLKIGGYPSLSKEIAMSSDIDRGKLEKIVLPGPSLEFRRSFGSSELFVGKSYRVTSNPLIDKGPVSLASDGKGNFVVGYTRQERKYDELIYQDGFAISEGGVLWKELFMRNGDEEIAHQYVSYAGKEKYGAATHYLGIGTRFDIILMYDMTNENRWYVLRYYFPTEPIYRIGRNTCAIAADYFRGDIQYIAAFTVDYRAYKQIPMFTASSSNSVVFMPRLENVQDIELATDFSSHYVLLAMVAPDGCYLGYLKHPDVWGDPIDGEVWGPYLLTNPDIAVTDGVGVVVGERDGTIVSMVTTDNGRNWEHESIVSADGEKPEIVSNEDGSFDCYFIRDGKIYVAHSEDGINWEDAKLVVGITNLNANDSFDVTTDGIVWPGNDGDLYSEVFISTSKVSIINIDTSPDKRYIVATIANSGTEDQRNFDWEIEVKEDNPLYILLHSDITRGRVWKGNLTTGTVSLLPSGEIIEVRSGRVFGLGSIKVVITAGDARAEEDGFLIGWIILLHHPNE